MFGVTNVTDLGEEVRIGIHVRLVNGGDENFSSAKATLRTLLPLPKPESEIPAVFLRAHSDTEFTQEFTMPRARLEMLNREPRLLLVLEFQGPDGQPSRQTIKLRRTALPTRGQ